MSEQNKAQVRRVIEEIYNRGHLGIVDEVAASNLVIHASSHDIRGREGAKQYVTALRGGFPNLHLTVEDQIAEGDMVVTRWTARGTHTGEFQGIPPTGREVRVAGTDIDRIIDGKTVECWVHMDQLGLMQQLGAVAVA
ncbi:MAG: ester cyclase [Phyllobacterium sp.]|uniref:ester cyclase n=1 Tax=Phyllobacterium sp. TaxID=1871046 RepID=UPI0030F032C0